LCSDQAPENPFEIDHSYYETLPLEEMAVSTGATVNFLQKVYLKDTPYADHGKYNLCIFRFDYKCHFYNYIS